MQIFIIYIGGFFAFTGVYAIIKSLESLGKEKSDSAIQMGLFKMKSPAGFVYGIIAIGIVIAMIKYNDIILNNDPNNKTSIEQLDFNKKSRLIKVNISRGEPISILEGEILIQYKSDSLIFTGIKGVSNKLYGNYSENSILINDAMKFYIKMVDSTILGVNVIDKSYETELEFYKEKNYKQPLPILHKGNQSNE